MAGSAPVSKYDVVVIGGGPAGYVGAIRAAQNGLRVACIDAWQNRDGTPAFGGTCLNAGCIPSKALLESSELFHRAGHEFARHGIRVNPPELDLAAMQSRKAGLVSQFTDGILGLFKSTASPGFLAAAISCRATDPFAPGSESGCWKPGVVQPRDRDPSSYRLPDSTVSHHRFLGALELSAVPARLGVIGGRVIGLELGSVWGRRADHGAGNMDRFLAGGRSDARDAQRQQKQGLDIRLGARVTGAGAVHRYRAVLWDERGRPAWKWIG